MSRYLLQSLNYTWLPADSPLSFCQLHLLRDYIMSLSPEQRREYRAIAHNLKPVIIVRDKGLSEGLQEELDRALNDHELIKIKVASQDREVRQEAIQALCESSGAELVQTIGKIAVILRRAKKPNPKLSNLLRNK